MNLYPEERETIVGVSAALRAGETTCADVLRSCIDQIERWEPQVHAWVYLDLDGAKEQCRRLDAEIAEGKFRGLLHGIPIGIKDIIDVGGMPTGCGSKLWKDRIAAQDARVVEELRKAGAIILGKTVTTAYAWIDPPVTRNPWNLERTPGGSSSGSAAAVATGMCLGAIGTQTGGSIIRPAAFCGVAGFKPSYSASSNEPGILPFAQSLDHAGPIARSVSDFAVMHRVLFLDAPNPIMDPPTIGLLGESFWQRAEPSMRFTFDVAIETFRAAGAQIRPPRVNIDFDRVIRLHRTIMASEAAANHRERLDKYPDDYPPRIQSLIEEGCEIPAFEYVRAIQLQKGARNLKGQWTSDEFLPLSRLLNFGEYLATPATLGPASDLTTTGDPSFNAPWSFFGFPTVTFPIGLDPDGLPLGIQLIGGDGQDQELIAAAAWCERAISAGSGDPRRAAALRQKGG